jgi:hypothetical protein
MNGISSFIWKFFSKDRFEQVERFYLKIGVKLHGNEKLKTSKRLTKFLWRAFVRAETAADR